MEQLYLQMLHLLAVKGYPKHPAQTPLEYARGNQTVLESPIAEAIAEICQAYVGWRYGNCPPNLDYLQQQWLALKQASRRLSAE